jgi:hypothetical protein
LKVVLGEHDRTIAHGPEVTMGVSKQILVNTVYSDESTHGARTSPIADRLLFISLCLN